MHRPHVFATPYSAGDKGFRIQAVTHLLTAVPARGMLGLVAGSAKVTLPALPDGVSAFGVRAVTNGYTVSCDNVSSVWLTDHAKDFQAYIEELGKTLARGNIRLDGYARSLILEGTVEIYVAHDGDTRFDLLDDLLMEEQDYRACLDLLRSAPVDARTPLAFAPGPGDSPYGEPAFMLGTQAWLDGRRLLIEYVVEDTGKTETVALDRQAFAERLEQAFHAMLEPSGRLRAAFSALAGHPA